MGVSERCSCCGGAVCVVGVAFCYSWPWFTACLIFGRYICDDVKASVKRSDVL